MSSRNHTIATLALGLSLLALTPRVRAEPKGDPVKQNPVPDARYVVRENEVFDKTTRLTWQRCTVGRHWEDGKGSVGTAHMLNWASAMQQGKNGWRLPTKDELETLVSTTCGKPALNRNIFPDVGLDGAWWYWTSTPYTKDAAGAWAVHFGDGGSGYAFPFKKGAVRLVRSGE